MYPAEAVIEWRRVPSRRIVGGYPTRVEEKVLFGLLTKTGIISGGQVQAYGILSPSERKARSLLNRMYHQKKVIEHRLRAGQKEHKIYTLGPVGAEVLGGIPYQPDYWMSLSDSEAIQRIMAFDLYYQMSKSLGAEVEVREGESPYIFTFAVKDKTYKVGAIWDNLTAFMEAYRWQPPRERVILICKELPAIEGLLGHLEEQAPVRAVTCQELRKGLVFYRPDKGGWQKQTLV